MSHFSLICFLMIYHFGSKILDVKHSDPHPKHVLNSKQPPRIEVRVRNDVHCDVRRRLWDFAEPGW
eukprot:SAG31_NODE_29973_length_387_cov_0.715278_1_plen_65_part_01